MEIEFVCKQTVKPASPTPDNLKKFGLSVFDQFNPDFYTPIVLFFPAGDGEMSFSGNRIKKLKVSLSETQVRFYPVAGRVDKEELYVDCDDGGVDFFETKVSGCLLSDILGRPDDQLLWKLLPCFTRDSGPGRLVRVQANVFECGGLAVGACFSHLIMDACAMSTFIKGWAAVARGELNTSPPHDLNIIASRFPAIPITRSSTPPIETPDACACSSRRFVFNGANVAALRDKAASACGGKPTRVSAVSALIWKSIVNALTSKLGRETRPSVVCQPIDVRRRLDPPFPSSSLGNMIVTAFAESAGDQIELEQLASQFKQGLNHVTQNYVANFEDSKEALMKTRELVREYVRFYTKSDIDFFVFTSWCRYGYYEADFGWGGPAWISTVNSDVKNVVIMMDDRDGDGIEAWVTLPERDMEFFEINPELLEFATLNPPM